MLIRAPRSLQRCMKECLSEFAGNKKNFKDVSTHAANCQRACFKKCGHKPGVPHWADTVGTAVTRAIEFIEG